MVNRICKKTNKWYRIQHFLSEFFGFLVEATVANKEIPIRWAPLRRSIYK